MRESGAVRTFVPRLKRTLRGTLAKLKINADVHVERIRGLPLTRVYVVAEEFAKLWRGERYDLVWRIVNEQFSRGERFRISMIAPLTPEEYLDYMPGRTRPKGQRA